MLWRRAIGYFVPFLWTLAPLYGVEKLADYYYFAGNPSFGTISGLRLVLFIIFALAGSFAAGALLRNLWRAAATQGIALLAMLLLLYDACNPRVCYSTGLDGFEPLRLGFFLFSVAFSGAALGVSSRGAKTTKTAEALAWFFGIVALCYLPVIFTFAGARLLTPFDPWALAGLLFVTAFPASVATSLVFGSRSGFLLPLAAIATLLALSAGIAAAYFPLVFFDVAAMAASTAAGATAGAAIVSARRSFALLNQSRISMLVALALVLVLSMTLLVTPDAVNGVVPGASGTTPIFSMGAPVYAGAFMDAPPGHSSGARVTVSFAGTNPAKIQTDNFLAAGIGIHSANCCVDGIDYSYRFDVYLFHGGSETLVASAWEVCDVNSACGGHSWKTLMFLHTEPLKASNVDNRINLSMFWTTSQAGDQVVWSYASGGEGSTHFANFVVESHENPNFNTGGGSGGVFVALQSGAYFYQFGIMSRYPIGQGGWTVHLTCPSLLNGVWSCVQHAKTLEGDQSYWKDIWRWGERYPNVSTLSEGARSILFSYSSDSTTPSFQTLW